MRLVSQPPDTDVWGFGPGRAYRFARLGSSQRAAARSPFVVGVRQPGVISAVPPWSRAATRAAIGSGPDSAPALTPYAPEAELLPGRRRGNLSSGPRRRSRMPQDPIERWEWEGGAIVVSANVAADGWRDEVRRQPSSSTTSSRRRPP